MDFQIVPFEIKQIAVKFRCNVIGITDTTATIYYELLREDGRLAEAGNRILPIAALGILSQRPISIAAVNMILSVDGITAIEQIPEQSGPIIQLL